MAYDERSRAPRRLIEKTRAQVMEKHIRIKQARRPTTDLNPQEAAAELHDWTMLYWEHLKRFRLDSRLEETWKNEPVIEVDESELTLSDLGDLRLRTTTETTRELDPETNAVREQTTRKPWTLPPTKAIQVVDALDDATHALGFDAKADRVGDETGAGLDDDPDPEEMEHLNAEVKVDAAGD